MFLPLQRWSRVCVTCCLAGTTLPSAAQPALEDLGNAARQSRWLGPFRWPLLWIYCGGLDVPKCAGDSPFLRAVISAPKNVGVIIKMYTVDRCRHHFLWKSSQFFSTEVAVATFLDPVCFLLIKPDAGPQSMFTHETQIILECSARAKTCQECPNFESRYAITSCTGSQKLLRSC